MMFRIRRLINEAIRGSARAAAANQFTRPLLNAVYGQLPMAGQEWIHSKFARIFYGKNIEGRWNLRFSNRSIAVPLTHGTSWLDWAIALSILGHDVDIKRVYLNAITSLVDRPDLFIDIGANTGTHSILFLVHGIDTICFEPNASCRQTLAALCAANGVLPKVEPYCLGARSAIVNLAFPVRETWLGSVKPEV